MNSRYSRKSASGHRAQKDKNPSQGGTEAQDFASGVLAGLISLQGGPDYASFCWAPLVRADWKLRPRNLNESTFSRRLAKRSKHCVHFTSSKAIIARKCSRGSALGAVNVAVILVR